MPITTEPHPGGSFEFRDDDGVCVAELTVAGEGYIAEPYVGLAGFDADLLDALLAARLLQRSLVAVDESRLRAVLAVGDFAVEEVLAHLTERPVEA